MATAPGTFEITTPTFPEATSRPAARLNNIWAGRSKPYRPHLWGTVYRLVAGGIVVSVMRGRCLCGAVEFTVDGPLRAIVYCDCTMYRRTSGHFVAATACAVSRLSIKRSESLKWYQSSADTQRGFCGECGSNLFWKPTSATYVSIMAGTLDDPTGLKAAAHIFVGEKSDYYALDDHLPQHIDGTHGVLLNFDAG
jgi:hypothetical protein